MVQNNELENIVRVGTIEKDFQILNFKVRMRTLTGDEIDTIMRAVSGYDEIAKFTGTQIMSLARSIVGINDKKVEYKPKDDEDPTSEVKRVEQNEKIIGTWQKSVIDIFYNQYAELRGEQESFLTESQASSEKSGAEKSGKSQKVSE
jgi:hypothetical protein